jgi:hypothetical protein
MTAFIITLMALGAAGVYLLAARGTFWYLTSLDWPHQAKKECINHSQHASYTRCTYREVQDIKENRNNRVLFSYLFPFFAIVWVLCIIAIGTYKVVTVPIATPAERREKRLELERDVDKAEAELHAISPTQTISPERRYR